VAAFDDVEITADRKPLAPPRVFADSADIDHATPPRQEPTMNLTLPRTPIVARINAVLAAALVTLVTLTAIDTLAVHEAATTQQPA
jgi:hypothetical protein